MGKKLYLYLGVGLWILAVIFVAVPIWPYVYYRLSPQTSEVLAAGLADTAAQIPTATGPTPTTAPQPTPKPELPQFDASLPEDNGVIIGKIGVRGQIHEGDDWQNILRKGIWRVPNFGDPENNDLPIILAAHRWGYLSWTNSFRTLNSFYNLPKLAIGDQIEIDWNQRKYLYEVYKEEIGTKITDYSANLILYTCELWNAPTRIIKYAKRVI